MQYGYNDKEVPASEEDKQFVIQALKWFVDTYQAFVDTEEQKAPDSDAEFSEAMKRIWRKEAEAGDPGKTDDDVDRMVASRSIKALETRIQILETAKILLQSFEKSEPVDIRDNELLLTVMLLKSVVESAISSPNLEEADLESLTDILSLMNSAINAIGIGENVLGSFDPLKNYE